MTTFPRATLATLTTTILLAACGTRPVAPNQETNMDAGVSNPLTAQAVTLSGPGSLDSTYQSGFGGFGELDNIATHVKALPNGKTLVVFSVDGDNPNGAFIALRQFTAAGTPDHTFGNYGTVMFNGAKAFMPSVTPEALVVTPEGRIFIAATGVNRNLFPYIERPIIYALKPNGDFDTSFKSFFPESASYPIMVSNGSGTNRISASDLFYDPETKSLTLGGTITPVLRPSIFWTLTLNVDHVNLRKENFVGESGAYLRLKGIERLDSGETILAGSVLRSSAEPARPFVARQADDGAVLGKLEWGIGEGGVFQSVKLSNGKALLAGSTFPNYGRPATGFVVRMTLGNFRFDPAFGTNGIRFAGNTVRDLAVAQDGKLVVVGGQGKSVMVSRMTPEGQMDTSFGSGGIAQPLPNIASDSTELAAALDLDARGRIMLGGVVQRPGVHDRSRVARVLP